MIDWLLNNHRSIIARSRWILVACAAALLAISRLPPTLMDRWLARVGVAAIALVFILWAVLALLAVFRPRLLDEIQRRRSETR